MTNKTPLQELIEWMDKEVLQGNVSTIKAKANELKAKEKSIIVDAYKAGGKSFADFDYTSLVMDRESEDYFNQTYKQ